MSDYREGELPDNEEDQAVYDSFLEVRVDHAMSLIDAENKDVSNVRSVVERMILAGYVKIDICGSGVSITNP